MFLGLRPAITVSRARKACVSLCIHTAQLTAVMKSMVTCFSLNTRVKNIRRFIFQQLQRRLPRLLCVSPSRLHQRRHLLLCSRRHPSFRCRFVCCLTLSRHPLCNPGSNVGKSFSAHLPLLLWRLSFWRCPLDCCPSRFLGCSHSSSTGSTDPPLLGSFGGFIWG